MTRNNCMSALRLGLAAAIFVSALLPVAARGHSVFAGLSPVQSWWLVMVALGLSLSVAALGTSWRWAGIMSSALLVGTSSQLGLTVPTWFQEIQLHLNSNFHIALYLAIAGQMSLALFVILTRGVMTPILTTMKALGPLRVALFAVLMLGVSATVMSYIANQDYFGYLIRLAAAAAFLAIDIATVVALAAALPGRGLAFVVDFIADRISIPGLAPRERAYDRYLPAAIAAWVLVVSSLICIFAFQRMAHLGDELAYVLQARYFALGHLSAQIPSVSLAPAFDYLFFNVVGDKWFSIFPPGWPLILVTGALFHVEWLVNPVLGGICILFAHALFRRELDRATANLVILLMAVSPWFLAMSASLMSHTATLALWLAACLLLSKARSASATRATWLALSAGLLMGLLFLARPLDGLVVGTLTGLWSLRLLATVRGWRAVLAYGLGCVVVGAVVFPYNAHLTGDPLLTPIDSYFEKRWDSSNKQLGFGSDVGPPKPWHGVDIWPGHSPGEAAVFAQHNSYVLNFELFGWGIGSLSMFLIHALWGRWSRTDRYMLAVIVGTIGGYSLYWGCGGFHIGSRYWFMTFLPFVAITASGIKTFAGKLRATADGPISAQRFACVIAVLCAVTMVSFVPWRGTTKYFEIRKFHSDYRTMLETGDLNDGLVFIRNTKPAEIGSASFFNPMPLDQRRPIFLRDLGPDSNRAVAAAFPGRPIYFAVGRAPDGTRAHIVAGPIRAEALP